MSREPEAIMAQHRQLGAALATFRQAAELTQAQVGADTGYDRTSINKIERGRQLPDRPFWQAADRLLGAEGALVKRYDELVASKREYAERQRLSIRVHHQADAQRLRRAGQPVASPSLRATDNNFAAPASPIFFPVSSYADATYLEAVQQHIWRIVELDNRFGGADLARLAVRFFRSVHQQLGTGAYEPAIERDLQATAGELAEVAGWLLYDADRQAGVRCMNQEALYFSRLAGDRTMELLTLQNASMHAGYLGRPREALHLARSVLESHDRLSPRMKTLFLMRKSRALAQGGDEQALRLFDQVRSHYEDGMRDSDPKWAWWINEQELAWHEGIALADLGCPREAVEKFEQSVWAMTDSPDGPCGTLDTAGLTEGQMSRLDDLFAALAELADSRGETKATSVRQPAALRRAAQVATELGMDESFTAAANRALEERIRVFAPQQALATHLDRFPEDRPRLAAVTLRRVAGTGHPAERHPDVVEAVAEWVEGREPDWMLVSVDETGDQVLRHVEMIAAGVGVRPTNVA